MRYKIREEILWKLVDGETVMVDPEKEEYSYLNSTGTEIWKMIDKGYSPVKIEEKFLEKYEVSGDTVKKDISEVIEKLLNQELIEKVE